MGIHGIYKEIGPGHRTALSAVAVSHFSTHGRPLRLAIDTSIWLFQIQSSKGGTNPALRTFYYRLLRLISLSIHPLFVFDGPNKPPFKRNKRTGPNVASIPEFLAKQLLKQFGMPFHLAPGEAEAECALLQREGIVDAVLSEDVDTLMFGSGMTFCKWSAETGRDGGKGKVPTHVNLYDAAVTKETSGLDREGMILVALMSGGDYVPEGIPGCGPKTACEAARAGFGHDLCQISRRDKAALKAWKEKLAHELHTNESKFFNRRHGKLSIPDDFPNPEVLGYYTHPVLSSKEKLDKLRRELKWDMDIDFAALRSFTSDAFDWTKVSGAKKFIRNLAPALLVRELRMRAEELAKHPARNAEEEEKFIKAIHGTRNHASTDGVTELRISFTPHALVPIDLENEEPDDEIGNDSTDDEDEEMLPPPSTLTEPAGSPTKKRGPYLYDPSQVEKLWVFETYVRAGAPHTTQAWEDRAKHARILVETRNANREAKRAEKEKASTSAAKGGMQKGALDRFAVPSSSAPSAVSSSQLMTTSQRPVRSSRAGKKKAPTKRDGAIQQFARVTKPGGSSTSTQPSKPLSSQSQKLPCGTMEHRWLGNGRLAVFKSPDPEPVVSTMNMNTETIDLLSSSPPKQTSPAPTMETRTEAAEAPPNSNPKRRRSPLRRWATDTEIVDSLVGCTRTRTRSKTPVQQLRGTEPEPGSASSLASLPAAKKAKAAKAKTTPKKNTKSKVNTMHQPISLLTSSPARQANLLEYFTPRRRAAAEQRRLEAIEHEPEHDDGGLCVGEQGETGMEELDLTGSPTPKARRPRMGRSFKPPPPSTREGYGYPAPGSFRVPTSSLALDLTASSSTIAASPPRQVIEAIAVNVQKKQVYRLRDSLPGAFALEELDMTHDIGTSKVNVRKGKRFRRSEVSVLDLTGD